MTDDEVAGAIRRTMHIVPPSADEVRITVGDLDQEDGPTLACICRPGDPEGWYREDCPTHGREDEEELDSDDVLRWALTTGAFGVPHLFDNNPQDSAFVRGHRLACAQILDVIENGWVNRRDPIDLYRDLGLTS